MKAIALLILASSFFVTASAQPTPDTLWTRTYGGNSSDEACSIDQTVDGGYIIAGTTGRSPEGVYRIFLVRIDINGDTLWTQTYCGENSTEVVASSVQQTSDGGYILTGRAYTLGATGEDFLLVRTDSQGDTMWTRTYGGSGIDAAYSVCQTSDDGFIVTGVTASFGLEHSYLYLIRTDSGGDTLWTLTYGGSWDHWGVSILQNRSGDFVVAGNKSPGWGVNQFLIKVNNLGQIMWSRSYAEHIFCWTNTVQETDDGGYILAGGRDFRTENPQTDPYLVKTDSLGYVQWTRSYGEGGFSDVAQSIQQINDGGFIIGGETRSFGAGSYDLYLIRTDRQGDTLWTRTYGGSEGEYGGTAQRTSDGGYILVGYTYSFGAGYSDFYLVKTGPDLQASEPIDVRIPEYCTLYPNFPNPFNASTQIVYELPKAGRVSLSVFNLLGEEITSLTNGVQAAGTHTVTFDGSSFSSGIYFARLDAGSFSQTRKMVLLK